MDSFFLCLFVSLCALTIDFHACRYGSIFLGCSIPIPNVLILLVHTPGGTWGFCLLCSNFLFFLLLRAGQPSKSSEGETLPHANRPLVFAWLLSLSTLKKPSPHLLLCWSLLKITVLSLRLLVLIGYCKNRLRISPPTWVQLVFNLMSS